MYRLHKPLKIHPPAENPYAMLMVDITHRCNMHCSNCYLPNRTAPDMDIDRLVACLEKLPKRTTIRLAGAEPTTRIDLPDIIYRVKKLGHRVVLLTNGLRLARRSYVQTLRDAGLRHVYISLNGVDRDDWYARIDKLPCARRKWQAVENIVASRMILNTGTILVRGVNEDAIARLLAKVSALSPRHAMLGFKNIGALGRYSEDDEAGNFTLHEMQDLLAKAIHCDVAALSRFSHAGLTGERKARLFPVDRQSRPGAGIWVRLTDWQASDDGAVGYGSLRRGRVTPDFMIAPFFEHVRENEWGY